MTSMTGYAYKEADADGAEVSVEIKSLNSRFLDLTINLPPYLSALEKRLRALVSKKVLRGRVELSLRIKEFSGDAEVVADINAAKSYANAISEIARALRHNADEVPLSAIVAQVISQPGVLNVEKKYDIERYWNMILPIVSDALDAFCADRMREGETLRNDLLEKLETLDECASLFEEWRPKMERLFKEQIVQKFDELLGGRVDEQRVMTETAALLVKYTINEEIVRLKSHLLAVRNEIAENPAPGKKIDFLCQEINREINTIGSKNQFAEIGAAVVAAKNALENMREQARNVE